MTMKKCNAALLSDRAVVRVSGPAATSFLQGLSAAELTRSEFDFRDQDYDMLIGVRAQKPLTAQ